MGKNETPDNWVIVGRRHIVSQASVVAAAVVWRFARDGHIVRMALEHAGIGDAGKLGIVELDDVVRPAIAHPRTQAADQLIDDFIEAAFVWDARGYTFGHKFLDIGDRALEITVLGAVFHCLERAHAAV